MKSKKGQFYVLISIILIVYLFLAITPQENINEPDSSFRQLYENYMDESSNVINSGIYDGNLSSRFSNFSAAYREYAKTKSPSFKMAYALKEYGTTIIGNSMSEQISVHAETERFNISSGTERAINSTTNLTLYIKNKAYSFTFTRDIELKAIFMKSERNEVIIHVEE